MQVGMVLAFPYLANIFKIAAAFWMQQFDNRRRLYILFGSLHRLLWTAKGLIPYLFPQALWVPVYILLYVGAFLGNSINAAYWTSLISDMVPARVRGKYFGIRNTVAVGSGQSDLVRRRSWIRLQFHHRGYAEIGTADVRGGILRHYGIGGLCRAADRRIFLRIDRNCSGMDRTNGPYVFNDRQALKAGVHY